MAGGASTRMGQPKAFIDYQGLPLWRFQANKLLGLRPKELLISAPRHLQFEEGPWKIVHDRQPDLGPLAGLDAALDVASADHLMVLAVDMPAMTIPFLQGLAEHADGKGIVPELDGFYHGLVAVYPAKIHPLIRQILLSEDRSVQHLIKRACTDDLMKIYLVKENERLLFQNLNSPSDF
jgi:molybdopterin-guanine dinucleotide biosynthesis protein A